jgi:xanthosine utilization system XapX-like protein
MINNLTYPIHLNVTLNGSLIGASKAWWSDPSVVALIGVLGILIGAIAAGLFQFHIERLRIKESEKNNRILAHSTLLGCKHAILKYYESYLVSIINAENLLLHSFYAATKGIDFTDVENCLMEQEIEAANQYASQALASQLEKSNDLT